MRLYQDEIEALKYALKDINENIYLFGSRVDNNKKGGDIDLLILSEMPDYELSKKIKTRFFLKCEEKIDITIINPKHMSKEQEAFLNSIKKEKLDLYE